MWLGSGGDSWLPSGRVLLAAAVMTLVVTPVLLFLGAPGIVILGVIVVVCLVIGGNARAKALGADELRESRPDD